MPEKLLAFRVAADRMGKSEEGLRWMMRQGSAPPSAMIGGRRMFREADVDAYIREAFGIAT